MRVSNLAIMMLTELAVTESTLRRCSASTPSHALALINLLAHRARGVSEMDWRGPFCHASGASQRGGSMPSSLVPRPLCCSQR